MAQRGDEGFLFHGDRDWDAHPPGTYGDATDAIYGSRLDAAVAKALGRPWRFKDGRCVIDLPPDPIVGCDFIAFAPSSNWAQGGPILERECIDLGFEASDDAQGQWVANNPVGYTQWGDTPLIAAMRCFVCSHFGDEVDLATKAPK